MQEPRIGVGVCTRNRPTCLTRLMINLIQCRNEGPIRYDIFIADDGSENAAQTHLLEDVKKIETKRRAEPGATHVDVVTNFGTPDSARVGIAKNKNRILRHFRDYDFIFIVEDDLLITNCSRWIIAHLEAYGATGYHHFGHVLRYTMGQTVMVPFFSDNVYVNFTEHCTGMFMFLTKTVLETVGGFDERFDLYGWEHMEYSERIVKAGLCGSQKLRLELGHEKACYPSLLNINELVDSDLPECILNEAERKEQMDKNQLVWDKSRQETGLFRPF